MHWKVSIVLATITLSFCWLGNKAFVSKEVKMKALVGSEQNI